MRIKYSQQLMGIMNVFSRLTRARLKDSFEEDGVLYFVVEPGEAGKAIGKKGAHVKLLEKELGKKVKVVEFALQAEAFIQRMLYPLNPSAVTQQEDVITVKGTDGVMRGQIIGRNAKNLNMLKRVVQRYFEIKDIRVE